MNKSIFTILAIFLFTFASVKAKIDAKPLKLQAMLNQQLVDSIQDNSASAGHSLKAVINIRN